MPFWSEFQDQNSVRSVRLSDLLSCKHENQIQPCRLLGINKAAEPHGPGRIVLESKLCLVTLPSPVDPGRRRGCRPRDGGRAVA